MDDVSFVERERIPEWAIQLGIRCHLAWMSLRDVYKNLEMLGVERRPATPVDPTTNELIHLRLFPTTTKQTARWFLAELHRRRRLDDPLFLVDGASYLGTVLDEDGYRFQVLSNGNRNAIGRVFCEMERRTSSFTNSVSHVEPETAQSWLEALAVYHNARQR